MITRKTTDKLTLMALLIRIRLKAVLTALFAAASTAASVAVAQVNCVTVTRFNDEAAAVAQTYYDGLGRLTHSISRGDGGDGEDVWQRTDYDRRGNLYRRWCRTPLTAGIELPTAQMFERAAEAFYGEGQYPYTRTMYEGNTTNRPTYVYGPGEAWQRHPEQYDYGTNDSTGQDAVRMLMSYVSLCATEETLYSSERNGVDLALSLAQNATWAYRYDGFGRLAQAMTADASMGESFEYDLNSNILNLERRYGGDAAQDAAMSYYGNRIASVNDASLPYYADIVPSFAAGTYTMEYDEDGRLTADGTRQITRITYTDNGAQMPQSIDFANGSRIINTYLPDGTLLRRDLRTIRTRTVVRVNAQGDTIVRTIREPVIDVTRYRGDWEINGSRWRLNTPEGIALIGSAATLDMASATDVASGSAANDEGTGTGTEATFSHLWYVRDRLGSVRSVVDATGTILQNTAYYASGVPVQCFGTRRVTDRGHIGNRYLDFAAIGWYDNTARMHDALLCRFTTRDLLAAKHPEHSPYLFCGANPLRYIDPSGQDIYCFDESGNLVKVIEDEGNDKVAIGNYDNGKYETYYTEELNGHGVINKYYTTSYKKENTTYDIEAYKVRGDKNATTIFETLGDHTDIEWSLVQTGQPGDKGLNFLSTSHKHSEDISGSYLFNRQLKYGYTLRAHYHNHPQNTPKPSINDTIFGKIVRMITKQNVRFYIYTIRDGFIEYTDKTGR